MTELGRRHAPRRRGSLARRLAKHDLSELAATNVVLAALTAATGIALAQALDPEGRGILALAIVWSIVAQQLMSVGVRLATVYYVADPDTPTQQLVRGASAIAVVSGAAILGIAVLAHLVGLIPSDLSWPLIWVFASSPFAVHAGVCNAVSQSEALLAWSRMRVIQPAAYLVLILGLAFLGIATAGSAAIAYSTSIIVQWIINYYVGVVRTGYRGLSFDRAELLRLVRYGRWTVMSAAVGLVNTRLDTLVLGGLVSRAEVGLYTVAVGMSQMILPLGSVAAPWILPRIARVDGARRSQEAKRAITLTLGLSLSLALPLAVFAPWAVRVLLGSQWLDAVSPLRWLLAGSVVLAVRNVAVSIINGAGFPKLVASSDALGAVMTITLLYPAVRYFGITGAAVTSLGAYGIATLLLLRAWKQIKRTEE